MATKSRINYNPSLSVKENAERCNVTESAVRKYIAEAGIDRRYDEQLREFNAVRMYHQTHKCAKPSDVAKALGMAVNTAKKYMRMGSPAKPATDKVSKVNLSKLTASICTKRPNSNLIRHPTSILQQRTNIRLRPYNIKRIFL